MHLDVPAFSALTVSISAASGFFMICYWLVNPAVTALAWWGGAYLAASAAAIMLGARGIIPDFVSIDIANALLLAAYGTLWSAVRRFDGRPALPGAAVLGPLVWLIACRIPAFYQVMPARVMLVSLVTSAYVLLAARDIWRRRCGWDLARATAAGALVVHGLFMLARAAAAPLAPFPAGGQPYDGNWAGLFVAKTALVFIVLAAALVTMARQQAEERQEAAAPGE